MFFYLEGLMQLSDLNVNQEFARQILDLYSDIVMLQQAEINCREAQAFINQVRESQVHLHIQQKFSPIADQIQRADGGHAIERFKEVLVQ
jgi:hypothetical protein